MKIPGDEAVCRKPGEFTVRPRLGEARWKRNIYCSYAVQNF